ncbi:MAG: hypothetical protein K2M06_09285 [Muribaculaceae bacterium]|nr:hypothetical protein [Muribaculaceae bacterium]
MEKDTPKEYNDSTQKRKTNVTFWTKKAIKWATNSAMFGMIITFAIFFYQEYESAQQAKDIVDNLVYVQKSLSTRYLGIFPNYLNQINELLDTAQPNDTIVIFEDVLYYGFVSKPHEFKKMQKKLIELSDSGCHVTMAYYNPKGRNFKRMIIDQYIATDISAQMDQERRDLLHNHDHDVNRRQSFREIRAKDSLLVDSYFCITRSKDPAKFKKSVDDRRKFLADPTRKGTALDIELENLYGKIDSIKSSCLSEDYDDLCIHDFEDMYREISILMAEEYQSHGIDLIRIDENLSISCWLVAEKAILAFPSKYATDEIGFYSHDPAFSKYIKTMLNGFIGNYSKKDDKYDKN